MAFPRQVQKGLRASFQRPGFHQGVKAVTVLSALMGLLGVGLTVRDYESLSSRSLTYNTAWGGGKGVVHL